MPPRSTPRTIPALIPKGQRIATIAVPTVLAAFSWRPGSPRYRRVARFVDELFDRIDKTAVARLRSEMEGRRSSRPCAGSGPLSGRAGMARPQRQRGRQGERAAMRRARLILVALVVSGRAVCAQSVDPEGKGLGVCLQAARGADDGCAKLTDDSAGRLACFQKARAAELECLEHALSGAPAGGPGQDTPAASAGPQPEPPPVAAATDAPAKSEIPKAEAAVSPPERPTGSVLANAPHARDLQGTEPPGKDQQAAPPANPDPVRATEVSPPLPAEASGAAPSTTGLRESSWVVSETTSPIDYSPLITAVIRPASRLPDGPSSLAVSCRRGHTELSIRSEAGWRPTRNDAVLVDHRVDKEPIVRLLWSLSADARTATYKEDAVELLRSLPEGGLLSISIPDGDNPRREATFLLAGWTAIRHKIEKQCRWPPAERVTYGQTREPSGRREAATAADSSSLSPAIPSDGPRRRAPAPHRTRR